MTRGALRQRGEGSGPPRVSAGRRPDTSRMRYVLVALSLLTAAAVPVAARASASPTTSHESLPRMKPRVETSSDAVQRAEVSAREAAVRHACPRASLPCRMPLSRRPLPLNAATTAETSGAVSLLTGEASSAARSVPSVFSMTADALNSESG